MKEMFQKGRYDYMSPCKANKNIANGTTDPEMSVSCHTAIAKAFP